jgi:hypothetical protein
LHHGYTLALHVGNLWRLDVPVYQLLHDGYTPESLISGGYSAEAIDEQRYHPNFGYITFSKLERLLPGANCCALWVRLTNHHERDSNS